MYRIPPDMNKLLETFVVNLLIVPGPEVTGNKLKARLVIEVFQDACYHIGYNMKNMQMTLTHGRITKLET